MKLNEFFGNKKNIFVCACVLVAIVALILIIVLLGGKKKDSKGNKLEKRFEELGTVYYEKYYNLIGEEQRTAHLSKFTTLGIKVDLENLARTVSDTNGLPSKDEILKEFVNKKGESCNMSSKIIFYPQEPYGEKDYKIELKLDCGEEK